MSRRLLLAAGSSDSSAIPDPIDPDPTDPTDPGAFEVWRHVGGVTATAQFNTTPVAGIAEDDPSNTAGVTYASIPHILRGGLDKIRLRLHNITSTTNITTVRMALDAGGITQPITVSGSEDITLNPGQSVLSDIITIDLAPGDVVRVREWIPEGAWSQVGAGAGATNANGREAARWVSGQQLTGALPAEHPGLDRPVPDPMQILGYTGAEVPSVAIIGDSIATQGGEWSATSGWARKALDAAGVAGVIYGVPVTRFTSGNDGRFGPDPTATLSAHTKGLIQFGVNDINNVSTAEVKSTAITLWRLIQSYGLADLWQTTTTPIVGTTDNCATLEGQTVGSMVADRQDWNAWLRDGAPMIDDVPVVAGAAGLRAGEEGHPLRGVVDVAAAVEQGGLDAPTGKWRVNNGPLGGDGVHPFINGQNYMAIPVTDWAATLT